ncbi:MAG: hypothetical protein ABIC68_05840 [Candidatus Omnitrophota bacterium]
MFIFVILFTMMTAVLLSVLSSHVRLMERHVRRLKAFYASQAASVAALDQYRRTGAAPASYTIDWSHDLTGAVISTKNVAISVNAPQVNSTCDYSITF